MLRQVFSYIFAPVASLYYHDCINLFIIVILLLLDID